ncbi:MAG: hypothetical protein JSV21_10930 [Nitrospirota bacterium]|nr:MAG: hypothetical protein JSV21_10930 [Nitrospirota bacterium]
MRAVLVNDYADVQFEEQEYEVDIHLVRRLRKISRTKARALAEAIILQAIEDLWEPTTRRGCLEFFKGEGFEICADIAEINSAKRIRMLQLLAGSSSRKR